MELLSLKASKAESGSVMQVKNPATEEPIAGVTVTLLGTDSAKYRAIQGRKNQAMFDRMRKGKNAIRYNAEAMEQESLEDLVSLTCAWTGIEDKGTVVEFSKDAAMFYYTELPWLKEQAQEFINDRANFL